MAGRAVAAQDLAHLALPGRRRADAPGGRALGVLLREERGVASLRAGAGGAEEEEPPSRRDVHWGAPCATQSRMVCLSALLSGAPLGMGFPEQAGLMEVAKILSMSTLWPRSGPHASTRSLEGQPSLEPPEVRLVTS